MEYPCPNCGYCPTCMRSNVAPYRYVPTLHPWYPLPYWWTTPPIHGSGSAVPAVTIPVSTTVTYRANEPTDA